MRLLIALAAIAGACACSAASAAIPFVEPVVSPNGVYSFYLDGQSTIFNGVAFSAKPLFAGGAFLNVTSGLSAGVPRAAGDPFTYRNRLLDADPLESPESKQWTLLGVVNTQQEIAFSGGPLGQTINTAGEPGGRLFLANIMLGPGGEFTTGLDLLIQLVNGTETVFSQRLIFPLIPEPAAVSLAAIGGLALAAMRRRSACR